MITMSKPTMAKFTIDNIAIETNWQTLTVEHLYPFDTKQISSTAYSFRKFTVELIAIGSTEAEKQVLTKINCIDIPNDDNKMVRINSATSSLTIKKEDILLLRIIVENE